MNKHLRILLAVALIVAPLKAAAQQLPTIPSGTVIGRTAIGTGPAQAVPIQQLFNTLLTGPLSVPSVNTNSILYKGATSGQATVSAQAVAGSPTILWPNTSGTVADNATSPIILNATTGNISCPSCLSVANATPVLASRAFALTQNLSTLAAVRTLGYSAGGDGGQATFKNIGSAPFIDSFITGYSITGGSLYTNGSYFGVIWSSGTKPLAVGTATVSAGAVAAVSIAGTPGNQCAVGDVYTPSNIGATGSGASITVTSCSTPLASFTDSVGTHFQFVPDGFPNILQFGAKGDWNGVDASATDNFNAIQAASWFSTFKSSTSYDAGGFWGNRVIVPQGSYLACGTGSASLIVGKNVSVQGASPAGGSTIKMCDTFSASTHFIELCDPTWHFACFGSSLRDISIFATRTVAANTNVAMIHSNNIQDGGGTFNIYVYSGQRVCLWFEKGFGGAGTINIEKFYCTINGGASQPAMKLGNTVASGLNFGTTIIKMETIGVGGPSTAPLHAGPGITLLGGFYSIDGVHCEQMSNCLDLNIPAGTGNGDIVRVHNLNAGSGSVTCVGAITLEGTNNSGNLIVGQVPAGSCTHVVQNGQSGGSNRDTAITTDVTFNP